MDGVSWTTSRPPESFSRSKTTTDTLSRLASFIARADAKQHRAQRPQSSALSCYACQECDQNFPHPADLLHHQEVTHTLPKPHRCPSCGRGFSLRSSLQLHRCDHAPACQLCCGDARLGPPCAACAARSSDAVRLQDTALHLQPRLPDSSPYACAPCGRGFSQKQALLHHQQAGCSEPPLASRIIDVSSLPDDSPPVSEADSAPSDSSDTPGSSGRALSECNDCSRSFHTETGLQRHREAEHTEERQPAARGPHAKAAGGANFRLKRSQLSKVRLLSCRSCDLVFRSTPRLLLHRKEKHSREKVVLAEPRLLSGRRRRPGAYPCQVCGKVFLHHLSLRAHYKHHSELSSTSSRDPPSPEGGAKDSETPMNKTNALTVSSGLVRPRKSRRVWMKCDVGSPQGVPVKEKQTVDGQKHPPAGGAGDLRPNAVKLSSASSHRAAPGRPRRECRRPKEEPDEDEEEEQQAGGGAKDSRPPETRTNSVRAEGQIHRAGPWRPRAEKRGWRCTREEEKPREEVPEEEELEENIDEDAEEEEEDEDEEWMYDEEEEGEQDRLWVSEDEDLVFEDQDEEDEEYEDDEDKEVEFPCPSCPEVFSLRSQLGKHVELHESSARWRSCSVCAHDVDTRRRSRSKRHRLYHCVPCRHGFSSLDSFLQHCQEHLRARVEEDFITEGYTPEGQKT